MNNVLKPSEVLASIVAMGNERLIAHTLESYIQACKKLEQESATYTQDVVSLQYKEGLTVGLGKALKHIPSDIPARGSVFTELNQANNDKNYLRHGINQKKNLIKELSLYLGLDEAAFLTERANSWRGKSCRHLDQLVISPEQALHMNVISGQHYWFTGSHVLEIRRCTNPTLEKLVAYPLNMHRESHNIELKNRQAQIIQAAGNEPENIGFI
jgi:hypothetical protein